MKKVIVRVYTDGFVYCLHDAKNSICRIGKTDKKANRRIEGQIGYYPFELIPTKIAVKNITECERYLHAKFKSLKLKSDWYYIEPTQFELAVKEYKKANRGQIHYKLDEEFEYNLKQGTMFNKTKRIIVFKSDNKQSNN